MKDSEQFAILAKWMDENRNNETIFPFDPKNHLDWTEKSYRSLLTADSAVWKQRINTTLKGRYSKVKRQLKGASGDPTPETCEIFIVTVAHLTHSYVQPCTLILMFFNSHRLLWVA